MAINLRKDAGDEPHGRTAHRADAESAAQEQDAGKPRNLLEQALSAATYLLPLMSELAAPTTGFVAARSGDRSDPFRGVTPKPGDILAVSRTGGVYQHYAVYVGGGRVIHYAAQGSDFGGKITVHEAPLAEFQGDADRIFVLDFSNGGRAALSRPGESPVFDLLRSVQYHEYTPEETIARARSRIGEDKYSLPFNNCEHFAIWCKTGVKESHQVNVWATRIARWIAAANRKK